MPVAVAKPTRKFPDKWYVSCYGVDWHPLCDVKGKPVMPHPRWKIEQTILANYERYQAEGKIPGLLPWTEHFKRFVTCIWGRPECARKFIWNPYAERMLDAAVEHKFLGISGHASSGKSEWGAIWGIANFLISPLTTKVFVTSTTLKESRMRIWGVIEAYWQEAEIFFAKFGGSAPGKLVSSQGSIVGNIDGKRSELVGLALIAGGKGQDSEASTKIGFKAKRVILIADELPLLTHKLYEAASSNLFSNPDFQMVGIGNLTSIFDPFGIFAEPADGWDSVSEDSPGWKTKLGYCIRFNGEQSPNVLAGHEIYPGLLRLDKLLFYQQKGTKHPEYYRMVLSFPCPTGADDAIYSAPELTSGLVMKSGSAWLDRPIPIAFLDPAFSKGGDRAAAAFGLLGYTQLPNGMKLQVLEKTETLDLMMKVNAKLKDKDRNEQLAELFIKECEKRGVAVPDRGSDVTGGGDPFATILSMKQGKGLTEVSFGGAASDLIISATDKRKGKDRFVNRVSELWYIGKSFIASGQIRGLDATTMMEMCARTYKNIGEKVRVEPKQDMKERTNGRSPDFADAWVGLVEVARVRHRFTPAAKSALIATPRSRGGDPYLRALFGDGKPRRESWKEANPSMGFTDSGGWGDNNS